MAIQSSARSSDGPDYRTLARRALAEDRAGSDRTSQSLLRPGTRATAVVVAQASGILSGGRAAASVATAGGVRVVGRVPDGRPIRAGMAVLRLEGEARRILAVERSLLNVLMHASGIASATARAVRATRRSRPRLQVWATRKTLPGLRDLEKAAVVDGGGQPHRRDLDAGLLIKSNHLEFVPLEEAIARARRHARAGERVEVEVRTAPEALRAARAGADALLIDNAPPGRARGIVRALVRAGLRKGRWVELSGGITPERVAEYREVGADALSLGALTHSAVAVPFHLDVRPVRLSQRAP